MDVLHINQDFPFQTAHPGLIRAIRAQRPWSHTVYVPVPPVVPESRFDPSDEPYEVVISTDYTERDRYLQTHKSRKILRSMGRQLDTAGFDLVHAHTLVAAGNVARRWRRAYGTPYVVSVRNTDLTTFLSRPRLFGRMAARTAEEASAIIALNPSHALELEERLAPFTSEPIGKKIAVVPNGIDDFWLNGAACTPADEGHAGGSDPLRVLYVGELTENKNLGRLIDALDALHRADSPVELRIVGDGPERDRLEQRCSDADFEAEVLGWTADRQELATHYRRSHLFAMPSLAETFGLVYIEALANGLPILYSRGQGVDGFFGEREVGIAVDATDTADIRRGLTTIIADRNAMASRCRPAAQRFAWHNVAAEMAEIYASTA